MARDKNLSRGCIWTQESKSCCLPGFRGQISPEIASFIRGSLLLNVQLWKRIVFYGNGGGKKTQTLALLWCLSHKRLPSQVVVGKLFGVTAM